MHELMPLPYLYTSLEPFLNAQTLETHHTKHHSGYVTKLNLALENLPEFKDLDLVSLLQNIDKIPQDKQTAVFNNGGQVYNHNIYWETLSPVQDQKPTGKLLEKINSTFGSLEKMQEEFSTLATNQFGSGWTWLSADKNGDLFLSSTSNADSSLFKGQTPLMTLDVWEHAYYLDYKNLRPDYIKTFWKYVNWSGISKKYQSI
jgi:Fe-Mn family superoxide dismutase